MSQNPRDWRIAKSLSQATVARAAGITGSNPARTYDRYERGQYLCPTQIVENVRRLSDGAVDAMSWHKVRLAYLAAAGGENSIFTEAADAGADS
ncbi:MAG: hypothetical protein GC182_08710 [Rhodopseudomonas sp.]|nr:hypothetical protein [Rhodopseudomonas sp.]